ncbi:hypothetical protein [Streptomyces sp. NPDC059761]|uniref:hypothetical protein n=1 Tax=Streptomyces sp. NPDC059761 TaxID=3346937 RepID=UPI0036501A07
MPNEMDLTDFRRDLTDVVDNLGDTGPLRLLKYGMPVAEIRSTNLDCEQRYAKAWIALVRRFDKMEILDHLGNLGLVNHSDLQELAERLDNLTEAGVTFSDYGEHYLPTEGPTTVDEVLARLHFGSAWPKTADDPYAWFEATSDLQKAAHERGKDTELAYPNAYDETRPTLSDLAIASGHTPDTFRRFGIQALDQRVALKKLDEMMGKNAIPSDVLALPHYNSYTFEQLVEGGLPVAEAATVFRRNLATDDAQNFVTAGIRTADEIEELIKGGFNAELAVRAHREGIEPDQWRRQLRQLQGLRYKGDGALPFNLLVEAAAEKLSLVRWDSGSYPVDAAKTLYDSGTGLKRRLQRYPWNEVFPDRIMDLARAGVPMTYVTAFGKLLSHHFKANNDGSFADLAITAYEKGLTADIANSISRQDSRAKRPAFTPDTLIAVLDEGLTHHTAQYLVEKHHNPATWITTLQKWNTLQPHIADFITKNTDTDAWQTVCAFALSYKGHKRARSRDLDYAIEGAVALLDAGTPAKMNDTQLNHLVSLTYWILAEGRYGHHIFKKEHAEAAPAVQALHLELLQVIEQHTPKDDDPAL